MSKQFEAGQNYRARALDAQIETIGENQTVLIEVLLEVVLGPLLGRRIKWRGWLNSEKNAKMAIEQLRATGWRGERFGEWIGLGAEEVDFECKIEERTVDGKVRRFPSAAFLRRPMALRPRNPTPKDVVDGLSKSFGGLLTVAAPDDERRGAPSSRREEQGPPDDDFGFEPPPGEGASFDQQEIGV